MYNLKRKFSWNLFYLQARLAPWLNYPQPNHYRIDQIETMWIRVEVIQESSGNTQLSQTLGPPPIPYIPQVMKNSPKTSTHFSLFRRSNDIRHNVTGCQQYKSVQYKSVQ